MIRLLIADDHAVVRRGLCQVLALATDIEVVAELSDGWQLLEYPGTNSIDLVVADMSMPGPSGVELINKLSQLWPDLPILVFSMYSDSHLAASVIKAGAKGYLTKDSDPDMILSAIRHCAAGAYYMHPSIGAKLMLEDAEAAGKELHSRLSAREYQIFLLLVRGLPLSLIAKELYISPKTVSTHKFRIMQKLGMTSISELIRYALRYRLIES
jgi:DNA-binding NarL/FixJ family response regulator